jgi:hypothetical protein
VLGAAGDDGGREPGHDPLRRAGDGLQPGGAEAVDRLAGDAGGQAGPLGGDAGDVEALGALGDGAAEQDVLDLGRVEPLGPPDRLGDGRPGHVVRPAGAQRAPRRPADGGPRAGDDDGFLHGGAPLSS